MNNTLVKELIADTLNGRITFPQIITTLSNAGFESYHIDYIRAEARYYHNNGETLLEKIDYIFPEVRESFSADEVQSAIRRSQAGAKYPDFIKDSTAAGCAYYIVYINGKKVRYLGRHGGEHIENFPGTN